MTDSASGSGSSLVMRILNITVIVLFYFSAVMIVVCLVGIFWEAFRDIVYGFPYPFFSLGGIEAGDPLRSHFFIDLVIFGVLLAVVILLKKFVLDKRSSPAATA